MKIHCSRPAFRYSRYVRSARIKTIISGIVLVAALTATPAQAQTASAAPVLSPLNIGRGALELLPLDNVSDLLGLRPGAFPLFGRDYQMRAAGRGDEVLLVDGVPVRNQTFGLTLMKPALTGLQRVELDASIADVSVPGGIGGAVRVQSFTAASGVDGTVRLTTEEFMPDRSLGANRLEASAAGRLGSAFTFSAGVNAQGNKSSPFTSNLKGIPLYIVTGIDTTVTEDVPGAGTRTTNVPLFERSREEARVPFSARDDYGAHLRLAYQADARTAIGGGIYLSRTQSRDPFGASCNCAAFLPTSQNGTFARSRVAALTIEHGISDALRLRAYAAHANDRFQAGALDPAFAVDERNPSFGFTTSNFEFLVDPAEFRVDQSLVERVLKNQGERTPFPIERTDLRTGSEYRFSPYGDYQFITRGVAGRHEYSEESRLNAGISAEYVTGRHRFDAGIDGSRIESRYIDIGYTNTEGLNVFVEDPVQYGAFVRDRIALGNVLVDVGVRFDYFNSNARYGLVPGYHDPAQPGDEAEAVSAVSPQAGATYRHDDRTAFAARFARSTRVPDLHDQFLNLNTDFFRYRNASPNIGFATPLELITADVFEFTATRTLASSVLDVSVFRNRQSGVPAFRREMVEDPTNPGHTPALLLVRSAGERIVDGATIRLGSSAVEERGWSIAYTVAKADEQNATSTLPKADPLSDLPMSAELAASGDTRHIVNGLIATDLGMLGSSELLRRTFVGATVAIASPVHTRSISLADSTSDWLTHVDLRLQHVLPFVGEKARVVVDLRNLLGSTRGLDVSALNASAVEAMVASYRHQLGGGFADDAIDLRTDQGGGIRYDADRAALLQTERRFGNGDGVFTSDEQNAAFTEAARFFLTSGLPGSPGRRLRIGVSVNF